MPSLAHLYPAPLPPPAGHHHIVVSIYGLWFFGYNLILIRKFLLCFLCSFLLNFFCCGSLFRWPTFPQWLPFLSCFHFIFRNFLLPQLINHEAWASLTLGALGNPYPVVTTEQSRVIWIPSPGIYHWEEVIPGALQPCLWADLSLNTLHKLKFTIILHCVLAKLHRSKTRKKKWGYDLQY